MNIKLIVFDVDGVLTDGRLWIGSDGQEYKAFHTQDGMAISLVHYAGIKTAIITGRRSTAVTKRAKELKINYIHQGIDNKRKILWNMIEDLEISQEQICYIGDDINDLPVMKSVGFPCAPNNAVSTVKEHAKYIAKANGGEGAVREILDHILSTQEDYEELIEGYLAGRVRVIQ
ncbi:KdsC family phosphatase [Oceanobacillus salinisoli]|uniref:KdsC family phosphatase n=1 Tax=Oceanobacillus salinisoli TaxID=2678611 RepID=UPI0012E2B653|nr:HAD-IIIA family hydrolase [Oceanobacillus salinisoli]